MPKMIYKGKAPARHGSEVICGDEMVKFFAGQGYEVEEVKPEPEKPAAKLSKPATKKG